MTDKEKLIELQLQADIEDEVSENTTQHRGYIADLMIANDVVIQKHGRWRWGENAMNQYGAWCTECECGWVCKDGDFDRVQGLVVVHKYCPNCGAKMDGKT